VRVNLAVELTSVWENLTMELSPEWKKSQHPNMDGRTPAEGNYQRFVCP